MVNEDILILVSIFSLILICAAYVFHSTVKKKRFGINMEFRKTGKITCPNCKNLITIKSGFKQPRSWNEILWGSLTCNQCGQKIDKWGRV